MVRRGLIALVAFVLFSSGLIHLAQPYFFIQSMAAYRILPLSLIGPVGFVIPYLHVVIALCLLMGLAERPALVFACSLFVVYVAAQAIVMIRGDTLSCGCFGLASKPVGLSSLAIPAVCSMICLALFRISGRFSMESDHVPNTR